MKIYVLPLGPQGEPRPEGKDGQFISLPIPSDPYLLRFVVSSVPPIANDASLWCNAPPDKDTPFDRKKFYKYPINASFNKETFIDVKISTAGTFSYYISYIPINDKYFDNFNPLVKYKTVSQEFLPKSQSDLHLFRETYMAAEMESRHRSTRKYYFSVSAGFELDGKPLALNSLAIQTVLSKLMGPVDTWDEKLAKIKAKGYNAVHFTPLQHRGSSDSPYSIFDQLKWDPVCFPNGEKEVARLVETMEKKHGLLPIIDVVLNHTAHNSEWLKDHPEAGYSWETAPHMRPAIELDNKLIEYSSKLTELGLPADVKTEDDVNKIADGLEKHVYQPLKLWEYYVVDVESTIEEIKRIISDKEWYGNLLPTRVPQNIRRSLSGLANYVIYEAGSNFDLFGSERFLRKVDPEYFISILKTLVHDVEKVPDEARRILNEINDPLYREYDEDKTNAVTELRGRAKYIRLESGGPKLGPITAETPFHEPYFTRIKLPNGDVMSLANNGFIWNADPTTDFASPKSRAYLRRQIVIWGDCVKLRYGNGPDDCPYLWDRMTKYTQLLAKYFHGLRIDNCHSTPIHVGEYFLDKARLVRNNLYIAAELFTGSEDLDKMYVERLGITSLIREAMQAWGPGELSRLVHRHGGRPIGSFSKQPLLKHGTKDEPDQDLHIVRYVPIHALFMDCTHDNEVPAQKRTVEDTLPTAALVSMCACAIGSTMGYDECYSHNLNVVTENRKYTFGGGIGDLKKLLYDVHYEMGQEGSEETYIHHEGQFITVHRLNPVTGIGWYLAARTKFHEDGDQKLNDVVINGSRVQGVKAAYALKYKGPEENGDKDHVHGIKTEIVELPHPTIEYNESSQETVIKFDKEFPQGGIILFKTTLNAIEYGLEDYLREGLGEVIKGLDLLDLNVILYKCDAEERDITNNERGVYNVPSYGSLTYAGLYGWVGPLSEMAQTNDMAHPICDNLRAGNWALEYTISRLEWYSDKYPNIVPFSKWLRERFNRIQEIPRTMIPRYFAVIIFTVFRSLRSHAMSLMPEDVEHGTFFLHRLALTSVQMLGQVPSSSVLPFTNVPSLAAGLPHFSTGYMRSWGRDVFISIKGLLLTTGRYEEAKQIILGFAATLKHGLIPNLLDGGRNPRYNARDATWFFLQTLQDYVDTVPDGISLLDEKVKRRFPLDDTWVPVDDSRAFAEQTSIREIIYEIFTRHAKGIEFREANAGPDIDQQMRDEGFNQKIHVDWRNGLVFGGNPWNCGTWMDKMGESERAGNKGYPGTPRDGAAIEITGLLKSALRWVNELQESGHFPWDKVTNQHGHEVTFKEWEKRVQNSFERAYYVPREPRQDRLYDVDPSIVHRRGIYKDLYGSSKPFEDYQLRPNFAIAMVVAPELFDVEKAIGAIAAADAIIRGPCGMRTLDPEDWNYRPYYRNSVDNDDFATAKGRNYHQGPEWLWCTGYFLRAMFLFDTMQKQKHGGEVFETMQQLYLRMHGANEWIHNSHWGGLTELTNKDGELCDDSSPTQAWSSATLIDLVHDVRLYQDYVKRSGHKR
uniref:Glycogen debranching enzyme n=1 Tax=Blastobotrys adeninivorans TaxID=409370 RepID=A0A060T7E8_BLAAD